MMDYYDYRDPKNLEASYRGCAFALIGIAVCVLLMLLSCTTTKYVPVENTHTETHWHTDSVKQIDSVYHEKETTIMQLDSAAMAKYGIQLKNAERAWLVKSWELERQIEALQRFTAELDTVRDSVQVPYPVEKKLTRWQQVKIDWGGEAIVLAIVVIFIVIWLLVKRFKLQR